MLCIPAGLKWFGGFVWFVVGSGLASFDFLSFNRDDENF